MPDVFDGGLPMSAYHERHTEKGRKTIEAFMNEGGAGYVPKCVEQLDAFARSVKGIFPSVNKLGALGFCLGGKVVIIASNRAETPIQASVQAHPGKLDIEDAKALTIPHLLLASKDEPTDVVEAFASTAKPTNSEVHTFPDSIHGWMGARADLADKHCCDEYLRG